MNLSKKELIEVNGGGILSTISGTLLNSIIKGVNAFMDVGRSLGSALRRIFGGTMCEI